PLQRRALPRDGGLHLALPLAERGLALLQAGVAGLLLALLLAQELESTLEVAVLLAQALLGALEILPFLAGLLLELGLGGGALLLDLEVDFLEADPSAALGLLLQGLGALPGPRQGGAR